MDDSIPNKEWCFNLSWTHQESGAEKEDVVLLSSSPHESSCASEGVKISEGNSYLSGEIEADMGVSRVSRHGESFYPSRWGCVRNLEEWCQNDN